MIFLANENFPSPGIDLLRNAGYQVNSIGERYSGISDLEVVRKASEDNSIILTFDKDYGEIIFKHANENPPAVIFFRFKGESPESAAITLLSLLNDGKYQFENKFTVIERDGIRQRTY
jgi:predicted nuclease of predicted toxin-antitoxin system